MSYNDKISENKEYLITAIGALAFILVFIIGGGFAKSDFESLRKLAPYVIWAGTGLFAFYAFLYITNSQLIKILGEETAARISFAIILRAYP